MRAPTVIIVAAFASLAPLATHGADLLAPAPEPIPAEEFDRRWSVAVGVYGWAAGLDADVRVGPLPTASVHLNFAEILEDLDLAAMAVAEVRYDRFGVFTDLFYTQLSTSETFVSGFVDARLGNHVFAGTALGEYRVVESGRSSLDAMAGARLWSVGGDLTVSGGGRTVSRESDNVWVDPMVGVKGRLQGDGPLFATGWGMIGGFGAGSDLGWDALAAVGYQVTDRISLIAGYRAVGVDYSDSDFDFDAVLHGPIVSGVIRF